MESLNSHSSHSSHSQGNTSTARPSNNGLWSQRSQKSCENINYHLAQSHTFDSDIFSSKTRCRKAIQTVGQLPMPNPTPEQPDLPLDGWDIQSARNLGTAEGRKAIRLAVKDILATRCSKAIQTVSQFPMPNPLPEQPDLSLFSWYILTAGNLDTAEGCQATRLAVKNILATRSSKAIQTVSQLLMPNPLPGQPDLLLYGWYIKTAGNLGTAEGRQATRLVVKDILATQCSKVIQTVNHLPMLNPIPGQPDLLLYSWYIKTAGNLGTAEGLNAMRLAVKDILAAGCSKLIQKISQLSMPNSLPEQPDLPLYGWYILNAGNLGTTQGRQATRLAVKDILATQCSTVIQTVSQLPMPNPIPEQPDLPLYSWYIKTAGKLGTAEGCQATRLAVKDIFATQCSTVIQTVSQLPMPNPIPEQPDLPLCGWYILTAGKLGTAEGYQATRLAVKDILTTKCSNVMQIVSELHLPNSRLEQSDLPLYGWYILTAGNLGTAEGCQAIRLAMKDILTTRCSKAIKILSELYMPNSRPEQSDLPLYGWYILTAGKLGIAEGCQAIRVAVKDILATGCGKFIQKTSQLSMPNPLPERSDLPLFIWYIKTAGKLDTAEGCQATRLAVKDILASQCSKVMQTVSQLLMPNPISGQPDLALFVWFIHAAGTIMFRKEAAIYLFKSKLPIQQKKDLLRILPDSIFNHCQNTFLSRTWPKSYHRLRKTIRVIKEARFNRAHSKTQDDINQPKRAKRAQLSLSPSTAPALPSLTYLPTAGILSQDHPTKSVSLPPSTSDASINITVSNTEYPYTTSTALPPSPVNAKNNS